MGTRPVNDAVSVNEQIPDIVLLSRTASRLSATTPLEAVLDEVIRFVASISKCDACLIYLLEKDDLVLKASKNSREHVVERLKADMGEGVEGWMVEPFKPVAIAARAYSDHRFQKFNKRSADRFEAFLSVPVVSGGRLVGIINLQNRSHHQYDERETQLVATIGFLIGAEIEKARLESENSELLDRLATRTYIDRAKGILQRNLHITEDEAYRMLRRQSQNKRMTMKEIAEAVMLGDDPMRIFR